MKRKATWIWYPGDFEVWLGNIFNNRRTERGVMFPPFWKQDSHWPTVVFTTEVSLEHDETIDIYCEGICNIAIDGKLQAPLSSLHLPPSTLHQKNSTLHQEPASTILPPPSTLHLQPFIIAGRHTLTLKVWNQQSPPALFIYGPTVKTDSSWQVTYEDKIWIDELGVAHGSGIYVPAASWNFDKPDTPPSAYRLERKELLPVGKEEVGKNAFLYDFGKETFGYLKLHNLKGIVRLYYGESREEALDKEHCETLDILSNPVCCDTVAASKAFRYIHIEKEEDADYDAVAVDYEYAPSAPEKSGSFRCSDDELNRIWEVSAYTLDLTTREFFCDGIKRDRWTWSGDAIQSYLMNYYLRFDTECVKRTIRQLRGKDPVTAHVNTIMDYTFYWFKSIADYYDYTGDLDFIREMWPKMVTLMDYVLGRATDKCMAEGQPDDWIFVDWTDFRMSKRGVLTFEQILFWKALKTMEACARSLGYDTKADDYAVLAKRVKDVTDYCLYSFRYEAYGHALENVSDERSGNTRYREDNTLTRFPNMFAIIYDFCSDETKQKLLRNALLNPDVPPITTPYMRFYELEALCQMGLQDRVLHEMKDYWGGMLRLGATTFWEKYNPGEQGTEHLAMYGRPYGKSLCHAWGASPLYLLGRYFLGVHPTQPGYRHYEVRPVLGGLQWMEGDVPTPFGRIHVAMNGEEVTVLSDGGEGLLVVGDERVTIPANERVTVHL